jgi:hypothetical protein
MRRTWNAKSKTYEEHVSAAETPITEDIRRILG